MKEGAKLKNFKGEMTGNKNFNLSDYKGQNIVIYFYPEIILLDVLQKEKILEIIIKNLKKRILKFLEYQKIRLNLMRALKINLNFHLN